ncbi:hypothetical protein CLOM_g11541 [Closterium sp. NIES-68]|nr:hypothetical protein CLOM_g11541 [Closterium sp. NIES-68]
MASDSQCGYPAELGDRSADESAHPQRSSSAGLEESSLLAGDFPSSAPLNTRSGTTAKTKTKSKHSKWRSGRRKPGRHEHGVTGKKSSPPLPRELTHRVYTLQNVLFRRFPSKLPLKATLLALYVSHFLSRWTNRMWEFAVPLFLLDASYAATSASSATDTSSSSSSAGSASLLLVALYGLSESLAMSLFSVPIGAWVDLCPRLPLAAAAVAGQNAALFLAAIAVAALLSFSAVLGAPSAANSGSPDLVSWVATGVEKGADVALVAAVCVLGAAAALLGLARGIAVERDWAVVIADWVCAQEAAAEGGSGRSREAAVEEGSRLNGACGGGEQVEGGEKGVVVVREVMDDEEDSGKRLEGSTAQQQQQQQQDDEQQDQRERVRARLNSTLRTIDLLCRLLAPAVTGALMAAAAVASSASPTPTPAAPSSPLLPPQPPRLLPPPPPPPPTRSCPLAAAAELLLLAVVHAQVPGLGKGRKGQGGRGGTVEDEADGERGREGEGDEEGEEEEEAGEGDEEHQAEEGAGGENGGGNEQLLKPVLSSPLSSTSSSTPLVSSDPPPPDSSITCASTTSPGTTSTLTLTPPLIPPLVQPSPRKPSLLDRLLSSLLHLRLLLSSWLSTFQAAWAIYYCQTSLLPSLSLALLYLTVLSFGSLMCAYLHSQGIPLGLLGSASGAAAVTGVLGATFFPSLCARLGPIQTAETSIWSQLACLLPCAVAGLVRQSSGPIPAVLLIAGVVLSRAPLWVFDLSVLQMVQGAVVEEERGAVGGVQESLQQGMQLVALVLAAVVSRPRDFWVLTTVSGGAVTVAAMLVSVDRRGRRVVGRMRRRLGWGTSRGEDGMGREGGSAAANEV